MVLDDPGKGGLGSAVKAFVKPVDQVGHRLELLGDHTEPVLPEELGIDVEGVRERLHHVVRGHGAVAVHEVVQVARREARLSRERPVGDARLVHQPLDRRAERLRRVAPEPGHYRTSLPRSATSTRRSSPLARSRTSTIPSSRLFLPAVILIGRPIRSASANFSPGRRSRSSRRTSSPTPSRAAAACSPISSAPFNTTRWTSYGARERGQTIPCSSWLCSTTAAITRPGPIP